MAPLLFSLALFARALIAAVAAHWASVGVLLLMRVDPDDAVATTRIVVVLLVLVTLIAISIIRMQPDGKGRMAAGPRLVAQWRQLVLAIGCASQFCGLLVFITGYDQAGSWGMGIGTTMVVCEMSAIVGAMMIRDRSAGPSTD